MFLGTEGFTDRPGREILPRNLRRGLQVATGAVAVLVLAPTLYLVVWSLFGTDVPGQLGRQPSFQWYGEVLGDADWLQSLAYSSVLAAGTSILGTLVSVTAAYFLRFAPQWAHTATFVAMTVALLNPIVPYGMSLSYVVTGWGLPEWSALAVGHLVLVMPVQYFILDAAQEKVSTPLLWSARSCGASHLRNLCGVFLLVQRPAVFACLAFGFFLSFDEVVCATFVVLGASLTVPLKLWNGASHLVRPDAAVVATLLLAGTAAVSRALVRPREAGVWVRRSVKKALEAYWREFVVWVTGAVITYLLLPPLGGSSGQTFNLAVSAVAGLVIATLFGLAKAWKCVRAILSNANAEDFGGVAKEFAHGAILHVVERLKQMRAGSWVDVTVEESRILAHSLFRNNEGTYIGTDRHTPTAYEKLYPEYLKSQMRRQSAGGDLRVLLYSFEDLQRDFKENPDVCINFVGEHQAKGIQLLVADRREAEALASRYHIPSTDIGIFNWAVVAYFEPPSERQTGRVQVAEIDERGANRLESYLDGLIEHERTGSVLLEGTHLKRQPLDVEARAALKELVRRR